MNTIPTIGAGPEAGRATAAVGLLRVRVANGAARAASLATENVAPAPTPLSERYYVVVVSGVEINARSTGKGATALNRKLPRGYYVYDRENCSRAVRAFPPSRRWPGPGVADTRNRLRAERYAARMNAENAA